MCEFISAVKDKDKNGKDKWYFLTYAQIHDTPQGKLIQKRFPGEGELIGHSAIRAYFELREGQGQNWECTDFTDPRNFPAVLERAIKRGDMAGFRIIPSGLLRKPLYDKYEADLKPLDDKCWELFANVENRNPLWRQ